MKTIVMKIKTDQTRRQMAPDELQCYLREIKRGCGIHGVVSRREERRKFKQAFGRNSEAMA